MKGVLNGLLSKGEKIDLISSKGGILDQIDSPNFKKISYPYKFSKNPAVTMLRYCMAQLLTMFMAAGYIFDRNTVFYINTILPVAPALMGKLTGKKVIYHYHENAFVKSGFYRALTKYMEKLADKIICVSDYQASFLKRKDGVKVIPNSLEENFQAKLFPNPSEAFDRKNVLMISSLKEYKGLKDFILLSQKMPEYKFTMVINADNAEIQEWIKENEISIPQNLFLYPRTQDVTYFYNNASLVLNLSNPELFIETFGMTVLEAMTCGLPVIVPPVGGVAEMVEDGFNGYKINVSDLDKIELTVKKILSDKEFYIKLADNALATSKRFSREAALEAIQKILE